MSMGSAWCNPGAECESAPGGTGGFRCNWLSSSSRCDRSCSTENSFKIIALKGLLQHQIDEVSCEPEGKAVPGIGGSSKRVDDPALVELSDAAIRVMDLMDSLLNCQLLASGNND